MQDTTTPNTDDAFVWGSRAIGREIGLTERQARHLLDTGRLPAKKINRTYVSTRRKLRAAVTPDAEETVR